MAYSYKGSISFGLVYIPVTLHSTIKENDIGFNMIDKKTMSRVKYKKTCADCEGREVKQEDIVKGFEYEDGKYVIFEDKDFEKLKSEKDKNITIEAFVGLDEIDPIYYDKPYFVLPDGGEKAFALLVNAMERERKVGIARAVFNNRETLLAIRVREGRMILNTLFFAGEIREVPGERTGTSGEKELDMAASLIENMTEPFEPKKYKDEYAEKVRAAVEAKIAGKQIRTVKKQAGPAVLDLMEALRQSLAMIAAPKAKPAPKRAARSEKKRAWPFFVCVHSI